MKSITEIVAFFAVGMVLKILSNIISAYPVFAQQLVLWMAWALLGLSAVLLAHNRLWHWRHRHDSATEMPHDN